MPAVGKVTLDAKEYEATLEKLKQKTASATQNMAGSAGKAGSAAEAAAKATADSAAKVGADVSAAGGALSAFGAAAGTHMGAAGQAISALAAGPIAALVGALGALAAVGIAVWDRLTLSSEEYAAKVAKVAERADKARQTLFGQHTEDTGYMERLQELASKEALSNASKAEAAALIKTLTGRYGELGLSINNVTGAIVGADEAQKRMLERQRKQKMSTLRRQIGSQEKKAYTQAQNAVTGMFIGEETANKIGLSFKSASAAKEQVAEVMEYRSLKDRLEMAERLRDASNTKSDMDNWQGVIDTLEKQITLQDELNSLRETGDINAQERAARLRREAEASQKKKDFLLEEARNAEYQRLITGTITAPDIPEVADQTYRVTGSVSSPDIPEVADQTYRVTGSVSSPDIPEVADQTYRVTGSIDAPEVQMVTNPELERAQIYQLINNLKKQGVELSREEAAEIIKGRQALASAAHYKEQIRSLSEQVQIQSLLAQGMDEAAQRQQILNELKRKGLSYDSASVDKILELNQKLGAIKLQNAQKKEAESLYGRALRVMGMNRQADEKSALQKAREQKGSELTDAEKASTLKLLHLTSQLEGLGSTNRMDFAVQTNALTARGGFQTGVRSRDDALTQYNNQMMNLSKNHLRVAEEIRQHLDNMMGD